MTPPPPPPSRRVISRAEWFKYVLAIAVICAIVIAIAWQFVQPAPPSRVVIATGSPQGAYYAFSQQYADYFKAQGIELVIRPTAGSAENYNLMRDPAAGVDLAIVQGGTAPPPAERPGLEAIASIAFEPVWVFTRDKPIALLTELAHRRVAIGPDGSGTRALALRLLADNGLNAENTTLSDLGSAQAADALQRGDIDAAVFVVAPSAPFIAKLLADRNMHLMDFERAEAYAHRYEDLSTMTLYEGVVDLAHNLPAHDVHMIAPAAALIAHSNTHPAVIQLMVQAAQRIHGRTNWIADAGVFPSLNYTELPIGDDARYHMTHGPNILQRMLPLWLAVLIMRVVILIVPLLVILIPLMRIAPPLYRWSIRKRIYRWYVTLRRIDTDLRDGADAEQVTQMRSDLLNLEKEIAALKVPLSYMQEFYNLRLHVAYIRDRLHDHVRQKDTP
ncbi:MAG: C4-dicarboxylate ABC transporter substrate-binding protein [Planctomycetes bacterium]|nr:C4-dicarboxylate ABC transporter substrate-binding protein [Planctomycetota bacterium]